MAHELVWHGHSNFQITTGERRILIDPFFEGNPAARMSPAEIDRANLILITHDHGDHVGQALDIAARTGASVVGVFDTVQSLVSQGLDENKALGMNIGGTVTAENLRIKMVQAEHSSATGVAAGYIITFEDDYCLYHAGDTGLFSSMEIFSVFHDIDLALLPIGGHFTMDPEQAAYACKLLKCRKVFPMHWGTFPVLEQNTASFSDRLGDIAPETGLIGASVGTPVALHKLPPDECRCD